MTKTQTQTQTPAARLLAQVESDERLAKQSEWHLNNLIYKAPEQFTPAMEVQLSNAIGAQPWTPIIRNRAAQMRVLVEALEWYGSGKHIFDSEPVDGPFGDEVQYGTYDDGDRARNAIASVAAMIGDADETG